jgi:hypothetical protein
MCCIFIEKQAQLFSDPVQSGMCGANSCVTIHRPMFLKQRNIRANSQQQNNPHGKYVLSTGVTKNIITVDLLKIIKTIQIQNILSLFTIYY